MSMLIEDEPVSTDSTRGIDLLDPSLETVKDGVLDPSLEMVKDGVWSLCMNTCRLRGTPSCLHPMGHTLDAQL